MAFLSRNFRRQVNIKKEKPKQCINAGCTNLAVTSLGLCKNCFKKKSSSLLGLRQLKYRIRPKRSCCGR